MCPPNAVWCPPNAMREALAIYVTRAGEKLRRERRHAPHMMIFLHKPSEPPWQAEYPLWGCFTEGEG